MNYNAPIVLAFWRDCGLPPALLEHKFDRYRRWRFDFAFPAVIAENHVAGGVAIEVQGGIWTRGRHTRGSGLIKEYEKLNAAAVAGWRVLYCTPPEVMTLKFARTIRAALSRNS